MEKQEKITSAPFSVPFKVAHKLYGILGAAGWRRIALCILDHIEFKLQMKRWRKQIAIMDRFIVIDPAAPEHKGKYLSVKLPKIKEE